MRSKVNQKDKFFGITLCFIFFFLAVSGFAQSFHDDISPSELAAAIESKMTNEQALAQLMMFAWIGEEPSPLIMEWIQRRQIGGVKVFGWNSVSTRVLARSVAQMQRASLAGPFSIPLFVATDQEGGWVRHVRGATSETPGNMAIGASGYPRDAYLAGYYIGKELALLGVNLNFAPTVDLYTNRDSALIGPRAFGSDPVSAGIFGIAFMKGHLAAGVIPTAKHFPGHGDTALDSHGVLPKIEINFDTLWNREFLPYRMMVSQELPAVMSGHLSFPLTEGGNTPATLSSWFLRDVLRDKIGFKGIIITDDMLMMGIISYMRSKARSAKQAIIAGNDIIMYSDTPLLNDELWTYLVESMRTEEEFRKVVREAARRILETKLTYLRGEKSVPFIPDQSRLAEELPGAEGSAFFLDLAARSVTIVKPEDPSSAFPLTREKAGRVLLAGKFFDFFRYGRRAFPGAASVNFSSAASEGFTASARNADTIILCLSDNSDLQMLRLLRNLNKNVYVISILNPVFTENIDWVTGAIAVYSYAPESFAAGFSVIIGKIPAFGRLPYER